jgi:signal transduction histidine kinase
MDETLRILIVDDDEVDRMAVRRALRAAGVQTELSEANNCATAIAILQRATFDCVFLDYRLPDQDGLVLIQELRGSGMRIPMIVLTGQGDEQIAVDLMKAGASDYLAKSRISPEALSRVLRHAIRVYRAEMQVALANQRLRESNELLTHQNQKLERQRQQIQLQNLQLLEASRLKSQFLATMSHELRTPMNAIIGFSQMLLRSSKNPLNSQQTDMANRILNNAKHLLSLINEILDFSRIEAGRLELHPEDFDLSVLIATTIEELNSLAQQKQLTLESKLDLNNPHVFNDRIRLHQILINLLSNAIKFTMEGSVCVEVHESVPDRITMVIRDTGIGIAPADLDHIFEPFRQVDQTMTRRHSGTGLGLAITDSLVQMMNGTISVESTVGQGTAFSIKLPRHVSSYNQPSNEKVLSSAGSDSFRLG